MQTQRQRLSHHRAWRRAGLSLLEIIVALAVLTGSAAILAQMVDLGARHAERSRQISEAQTLAHNLLSELLADLRPWESTQAPQPVDLWSPWDYQLQIEPVGLGDLVAVTVTVVERVEAGAPAAAPLEAPAPDPTVLTQRRHYRLTRWVRRKMAADHEFPSFQRQGSPSANIPQASAEGFQFGDR
jgi:hypothetical protein